MAAAAPLLNVNDLIARGRIIPGDEPAPGAAIAECNYLSRMS
jgi:hypothetical protein